MNANELFLRLQAALGAAGLMWQVGAGETRTKTEGKRKLDSVFGFLLSQLSKRRDV